MFYLVTENEPKAPRILFRTESRIEAERYAMECALRKQDHRRLADYYKGPWALVELAVTRVATYDEPANGSIMVPTGIIAPNVGLCVRYTTPEWYAETFGNHVAGG